MASVLTDQYVSGSRAVQLAPVPAVVTPVVFKTPDSVGGNFRVFLPIKSNPSTSVAKRYRVTLSGTCKAASNFTINLNINDTAGTATTIATTGAISGGGFTIPYLLFFDILIDPASTIGITGSQYKAVGNTAPVFATITANPTLVLTGVNEVSVSVSALLSSADATSFLNITELTAERL